MSKQLYYLIIFLIPLLLSNASLSASSFSSQDTTTEKDYRFERGLTTEEGLPANGVNNIIQSSDGYIWAATYNGLVRYDGTSITVYNSSDIVGLNSNRFLNVMEGPGNKIWATLENHQFISVGKDSIQAYELDYPGISVNDHITLLSFPDQENIWVGSGYGLFEFDGESFTKIKELPSDGVVEIINTEIEALILLRKSLYRFSKTEQTFEKLLEIDQNNILRNGKSFRQKFDRDHFLFSDLIQYNGSYFLSAHSALLTYNNGNFEILLNSENAGLLNINGFDIDREGKIFLAGNEGVRVAEFDQDNQLIFNSLSELPSKNVMVDSEGSIWSASISHGIRQFVKTPIYNGNQYQTLEGKSLTANLIDQNGNHWFGSNCNDLMLYTENSIQRYGPSDGLTNNCVWSLLERNNGDLLAGTWGASIFRFDDASNRFTPFQIDGFEQVRAVLSMYEDSDDVLWAGTYFSGLFRIEDSSAEQILMEDGSITPGVRAIFKDAGDLTWVATDIGIGLIKNNSIELQTQLNLLSTHNFRTITQTDNGDLWFGSYGGGIVILQNNGEIKTLTRDNGLFDETISQMIFDQENNLWLGGNSGIFNIENSQVSQFLNSEIEEVRVSRYGTDEGMPTRETAGGFTPSALLNSNGILYVPTVQGVAVVNTNMKKIDRIPPKVVLKYIQVDGRQVQSDQLEKLPHTVQRLSFRIAALSYINPKFHRYQYKLEGFDNEWQETDGSQDISFTTLNPGDYTLLVRASNSDGIWSENMVISSFSIAPPFWKTIPFYILSILFIAILLRIFYQIKVRNIRKRNEFLEERVEERTESLRQINEELKNLIDEKNRLHAILAHDLRNPFTSIIGYMELLKEDLSSTDNEQEVMIVNALLSAGKNTYNLLENLLHWSNSTGRGLTPDFNNQDLVKLIEESIQMTEIQAVFKRIKIEFNYTEPVCVVADRNMILTVLRNILSNAIKFSNEDSTVIIHLEMDDSDVTVFIRDTGIGMDKKEMDLLFKDVSNSTRRGTRGERGIGLGLTLCKEFVDIHGGKLTAKSEPNQGSTFSFTLKRCSSPD
jgi:signal transduction histidine kinase/ligand-binding sensor domain-containing protein